LQKWDAPDVQGADLDVLQGCGQILQRSILAIEIEVEFAQMYKNQPLFSDVDQFLTPLGFHLFNIETRAGGSRSPRAISPITSNKKGQLLWGDALYFRDPIDENAHLVTQNPDQIIKIACIADILGYVDYGLELLHYLTLKYGDNPDYNFAPEIVKILNQFPNLVEQGLENLPIVSTLSSYL
jgi:hypothetical protein